MPRPEGEVGSALAGIRGQRRPGAFADDAVGSQTLAGLKSDHCLFRVLPEITVGENLKAGFYERILKLRHVVALTAAAKDRVGVGRSARRGRRRGPSTHPYPFRLPQIPLAIIQ